MNSVWPTVGSLWWASHGFWMRESALRPWSCRPPNHMLYSADYLGFQPGGVHALWPPYSRLLSRPRRSPVPLGCLNDIKAPCEWPDAGIWRECSHDPIPPNQYCTYCLYHSPQSFSCLNIINRNIFVVHKEKTTLITVVSKTAIFQSIFR